MESPKNWDERIESGQGRSVCQEQPVVDDLVFQRSTSHLKPAEHTSAAVHEHFSFEWPIGKVQTTVDPARLLSVYAERDTDASFLAGRDFIHEAVQIEVLPLIEDGLTVGIGRVAIDEVPRSAFCMASLKSNCSNVVPAVRRLHTWTRRAKDSDVIGVCTPHGVDMYPSDFRKRTPPP